MECLLAICMYAEVAIGSVFDEDLAPAQSEYGTLVESRSDPFSMGHVSVGADYTAGRYSLYGEVEHRSIIANTDDLGVNSVWIGARVRF